MPNWSNSRITISLNQHADLTQAQRQVRWEVWRDLRNILEDWVVGWDGDSCNSPDVFQIIHPRPKEEDENWYEWNNENWGTKWDMRVNGFNFENEELTFCGDTAWNAPTGILNKLVSLGFNMKHLFASMENDDWGYHIHRNEGLTFPYKRQHLGNAHRMRDSNLEEFNQQYEDIDEDEVYEFALKFTLMGDFFLNLPEGLDGSDLDYFRDELHFICDENQQDLQAHIDNQENENDEEFKELRNEIMESLDDLKDKGYVNDGFYLWWCNQLKGVEKGDMNGLHGISEVIHFHKEERHEMINYYSGKDKSWLNGGEPNLIKMYEVF